MARIIGYGICGGGEAGRYLRGSLKEFDRLCDETIILGNNTGKEERDMIEEFGFHYVEDNREWGKNQHRIKEDFVSTHVAALEPDICVCLDMDERFVNVTREKIEEIFETNQAFHVYIVNLWNDGWREDWSFWNVRMWGWKYRDMLGDTFFKFESRPLHCGLAPKWAYALNIHAPFVLEHYGLKKKEDRQKKVDRYEKYDPEQRYRHPSYYEALKTDHSQEYDKDEVVRMVEEEMDKLQQPLNREPHIRKNMEKKVLILREADGFVFDVPESQVHQYTRQTYKGEGFSVVDDAPVAKGSIAKTPDKTLVYAGRHNQTGVDDTEGHISRAFEELGWNVKRVPEGQNLPDGDVLLYHKWIPPAFDGTKVSWYFDKIYFNNRADQVEKIVAASDFFFATDGDGIKKMGDKCHVLRQGVGYDCRGGKQIDAPDIAFTGSLYGERGEWWKEIEEKYDAKHYQGVHGYDMNDLCVSAKIMIAPTYPCTDNYWSNRVYDTLGRGGFMLHPYCEGLLEEFEDGVHLVLYKDDLFEKIDYYLEHDEEREKIRKAGRDLVRKKYTYKKRVEQLCEHLAKQN